MILLSDANRELRAKSRVRLAAAVRPSTRDLSILIVMNDLIVPVKSFVPTAALACAGFPGQPDLSMRLCSEMADKYDFFLNQSIILLSKQSEKCQQLFFPPSTSERASCRAHE